MTTLQLFATTTFLGVLLIFVPFGIVALIKTIKEGR